MNKLFIIGNLTSDPASRQVSSANGPVNVCTFTVAVNNRKSNDATFFRVTAWRGLSDLCMKYLQKGRKVAVTGSVSCSCYTTQQGQARANLDVTADEVEFLSSRQQGDADDSEFVNDPSGMQAVSGEGLPF